MTITVAFGVYECDNWVKYLNNILNEIKTKLINYNELLIIDDRKDQSVNLEEFIEDKSIKFNIVQHGSNLKVLSVRLSAINNCKSEYLWIIDMDDELLEYDFSKISAERTPDLIYFNYFYPDKVIYNAKWMVDLIKNIDIMFSKFKKYEINFKFKDTLSRVYFLLKYENKTKAVWFKFINVNFIKSVIAKIDLSKFKFLRYSDDVLLNLYIFDNISKILIVNDLLPYIYDNKSVYSYLPIDEHGKPNKNINPEVIKSWEWIYNNTPDFEIKRRWFENNKQIYKDCIDFSKYKL